MDLSGIDPLVLGTAVAVLLAVGLATAWLMISTSARRRSFEDRYGGEYDRAVAREGSHRRASRTLEDRDRRRATFEVRPVPERDREVLRDRWEPLQSSFLDGPADAVHRAQALLDEVATAKGYPVTEDPDERWSDLSYDHPSEVDRYLECARQERPSTESARQTMLAARTLFEAMVGSVDITDASARSLGYLDELPSDVAELEKQVDDTGVASTVGSSAYGNGRLDDSGREDERTVELAGAESTWETPLMEDDGLPPEQAEAHRTTGAEAVERVEPSAG